MSLLRGEVQATREMVHALLGILRPSEKQPTARRAMVSRVLAIDYAHCNGGSYRLKEQQARREGLGFWAGRLEMPWEWRQRHY
jgi:endonuclease YncB( thermonuclease family)